MEPNVIPYIIVLSIGIIVSLIFNVINICQTKKLHAKRLKHDEQIQRKEYKIRLLNEINDWATSIPKVITEGISLPSPTELVSLAGKQKGEVAEFTNFLNRIRWLQKYETIKYESKGVETVALIFKSDNLNDAISKVITNLEAHIEVLEKATGEPPNRRPDKGKCTQTRNNLIESAVELSITVNNLKANLVSNDS